MTVLKITQETMRLKVCGESNLLPYLSLQGLLYEMPTLGNYDCGCGQGPSSSSLLPRQPHSSRSLIRWRGRFFTSSERLCSLAPISQRCRRGLDKGSFQIQPALHMTQQRISHISSPVASQLQPSQVVLGAGHQVLGFS